MKVGKNFQGVDKASAGYKLLSAMGWKEGEGLGAQKQGITEHVKVKKKFDQSGVGAAEAAARARDWSLGMVNFESVLSNLKEVTSHHSKRGGSSSDDSSEEEEGVEEQPSRKKQKTRPTKSNTDTEEAKSAKSKKAAKSNAAAEVAQPGKSAAALEVKKPEKSDVVVEAKKRTNSKQSINKLTRSQPDPSRPQSSEHESSSGPDSGSDSDSSSGSEPGTHRSGQVGGKKVASHVGRYRRRESAKMVKHYSSADLAAILGSSSAASSDTIAPSLVPISAPAIAVERGGLGSSRPPSFADAAIATLKPEPAREASLKPATPPQEAAPAPAPASRWWSSMFVQARGIGGQHKEPSVVPPPSHRGKEPEITINGFSEQDQENLYNKAQSHRSQGRQGLGVGDKPKLAPGSRWAGTKTRIVDSDDEEQQPGATADQGQAAQNLTGTASQTNAGSKADCASDVIVVLPPLRHRTEAPQRNGEMDALQIEAGRSIETGAKEVRGQEEGEGVAQEKQEGGSSKTKEGKKSKKASKQQRDQLRAAIGEGTGLEGGGQKQATGNKQGRLGEPSDKQEPTAEAGAAPSVAETQVGGSAPAELGNKKRRKGGEDKVTKKKGKVASEELDPACKAEATPSTASPEGNREGVTNGKDGKVKWKSIVRKILKQQPKQRLKVEKLQRAALEAADVEKDGAMAATGALMHELRKRNSVFEVTAKHVVLLA